ncbi:inactive transglutaminase family protein [Pseudomonas abietaniphila]|uniref:osmotic stress tolerance membrane protein RloB n=1 Tax=Pseudomonas abietaniphila TaxID=89065 RepID=UPI0032162E75
MRSLTLHLKILITALVALGTAITAYQILVLGIPVTEDETDDLWNIDAKVEFVANPKDSVKVQMYVPPLSRDYISLNESFISNNYGVNVNRADGNRKVTWSARRANGNQTLYYRLVLTKRYSGEKSKVKGPIFRDSIAVEGPEKIAADALLAPIRQHSADVETFVSEAIRRVNNLSDDNVKLLLAGDTSVQNKARITEILLSIAHVPVEKVHTIRLVADQPQTPELWLRSFNGKDWLYFNPETGEAGLPQDRLLWWIGDDNLITVEGGKKAAVSFSLNNSEMNAIRLAKLTDESTDADFLEYSLYGLPLQTQQTFMIMVMIPIGVLVILILRNLIGLQTLGTFTPVLIALAFRETQLGFGIVLFTIITALGLSLRSYLEHLKLQMLPRLSVVLTFVVVLIAAISLFSHKLGLERGLSVALFPMVILTMTIERLSITWEERGGSHAMKVAIGTLFAASLAHIIMSVPEFIYFVFTFPAILLILVGFMLAMGRYRGYRLTELVRFKAFLKEDAERENVK